LNFEPDATPLAVLAANAAADLDELGTQARQAAGSTKEEGER
jgi:hypothetical protein